MFSAWKNMQLHAQSLGQGQPLIVLHGLFGSLQNWLVVSRTLAGQFRVIVVDQRNHGHSSHSDEMNYRLMAQDLEEFMRTHHLDRAHVMGHSMGGKTAMQFALLYPERVDKLIVVDIAPRAYVPRHQTMLEGMRALDLNAFQTRKQMEEALAPFVPDLSVRQFLLKNVTRHPDGTFGWKLGLREINKNYPALSEALVGEAPVDVPALFLRGENSDYLREEDMQVIRRFFSRARMRTIPRAGHLVHAENPAAFLEAVQQFLRSDNP